MIEVESLTKRYGRVTAVDGLSFQVDGGRVTGFLGPNGAGKSTTMRMILGLDHPTAGTARIGGRAYRELRHPLREVGALLDARAVHGGRTARDHLLCLARSNGIPASRVGEVLGIVGLSDVAGRRVGGFSLGMAQRLGIAAALLGDPGILLFDEPVNGLDPEGILWIRTLMRDLAAEGRTVFVSSHLMSEMAQTADHLIVIGRGRLVADTGVDVFIARSSRRYVRVRAPRLADLAALLKTTGEVEDHGDHLRVTGMPAAEVGEAAAGAGLTLHELATVEPTLEAAYMELTKGTGETREIGEYVS
ncbi:ABC-2 type transport system ATP-binding protein [Thermocatellispora tengchongensis]|uniref:ABC-2 type transport system ATP-binding protein n=1 Tax=Thermocatellispora tengchongensis TaxID=1073253 RepID=A0A840PEW1_9ACTN|nr:ATP-binding cassette domain-containing protein [Thermocatellispora tengchongensis]MBB5137712.1 ABC-2 type transport system ATP-binding protein [Thermocatellispora tengchongensis]